MASFVRNHLTVNGVETEVLIAGDGPPLVNFHGGGIVEGVDCLLPLAERFRVVVGYHPGFGGTASDPRIDGIDGWVRHYVGVLEQLEIDDFVAIGHSLGGWLAVRFALAHPGRVPRLVLAAPFGLHAPDHPVANLGALAPEDVYGVLTRDDSIWEGRLPSPLTDAFLADRAREGQSIGQVVKAPFDPGLDELLPTLDIPVLLAWGDDDRVVPIEHQPLWEAALPNVTVKTYPGRGHLL